jgi:hypothetical protein
MARFIRILTAMARETGKESGVSAEGWRNPELAPQLDILGPAGVFRRNFSDITDIQGLA